MHIQSLRTAMGLSVLALLGALTTGGAALANDTIQERARDHAETLRSHRRNPVPQELEEDLRRAVELFREAEDAPDGAKVQARLVKQVGGLTKLRDERIRIAAIDALGVMGHEGCAKYLRPFLKPLRDGKGMKPALAAIEAAGEVADPSLALPLLRVVDKSKNYRVAGAAVRALGKFGDCKRHRERIVEELAATLRPDLPSSPKRGRDAQNAYIPGKQGRSGTARWGTLSPIVPRALNELTGREITSILDWMDMVREYKRDLGALFTEDWNT